MSARPRPRVRGLGARLPGIVMSDVEGSALTQRATMDRHHLVFQDGRIVIKVPLEDGAVRDLDKTGAHLDLSKRDHLAIHTGVGDRTGGIAAGEKQRDEQQQSRADQQPVKRGPVDRSSRRKETSFLRIRVRAWQPVEKEPLPGSSRRKETPFIGIWVKFESPDVDCYGCLTGCGQSMGRRTHSPWRPG